jgi:uracil phosphoribosyltransferase
LSAQIVKCTAFCCSDIDERHVLLMDPILGTGNCASYAIELLLKKGVPQDKIVFLTLISVSHLPNPHLFVIECKET